MSSACSRSSAPRACTWEGNPGSVTIASSVTRHSNWAEAGFPRRAVRRTARVTMACGRGRGPRSVPDGSSRRATPSIMSETAPVWSRKEAPMTTVTRGDRITIDSAKAGEAPRRAPSSRSSSMTTGPATGWPGTTATSPRCDPPPAPCTQRTPARARSDGAEAPAVFRYRPSAAGRGWWPRRTA